MLRAITIFYYLYYRSKCGGYAEVCCSVKESQPNDRLEDGVCGKSAVRQSNRVVGGAPADLGISVNIYIHIK